MSHSWRAPAIGSWLIVRLILAAAGPSLGQSYVRAPCAGSAPAFVDQLQPLWYRRFWTGECKDLSPLRCSSGRPYWNDVVRILTARAPQAQRAEAARRACRLGRQIGFEWTRPSAVRRIDTNELKSLATSLNMAPDTLAGLGAVEARIKGKVGP